MWIALLVVSFLCLAVSPRHWHDVCYVSIGLSISKICSAWFILNDILAVETLIMLAAGGLGGWHYRNTPESSQPSFISFSRGMVVVLLPLVLFRAFVFDYATIPSSSMRPLMAVGDSWAVNKFSYGLRAPFMNQRFLLASQPQRGDVAFFQYPRNEAEVYVKRVIGLPGDTVSYRAKRLTINGNPVPHTPVGTYSYVDENLGNVTMSVFQETLNGKIFRVTERDNRPTYDRSGVLNYPGREHCQYRADEFICKVPAGHYFMMGDNRDNSSDSRYWGFVSDRQLVGRVTGRLFRKE